MRMHDMNSLESARDPLPRATEHACKSLRDIGEVRVSAMGDCLTRGIPQEYVDAAVEYTCTVSPLFSLE
jgi:hypothetical protein